MANIKYDIIEDNYSPHISALCKLSIVFGTDNFSYAVVDNQLKTQAYQHYVLEQDAQGGVDWTTFLSDFKSPRDILTRNYRAVRAMVVAPVFTLVPAQWYRAEERQTYLQHLTPAGSNASIHTDVIPGYPINVVFEIPQPCQHWLNQIQPEAEYVHCVSALVPLLRSRMETPHNVAAYFLSNRIFVFYFHEGQLIFCNSFTYATPQDALYFLMLVFDQFRLGTEYTPLWICGQYSQQSELHRQIKRYIKSLQYVHLPTGFRTGSKLNAVPEHYYVDLLAGI